GGEGRKNHGTSSMYRVVFALAVSRCRPSGVKASCDTNPPRSYSGVRRSQRRTSCPLPVSHNLTTLSSPTVAAYLPSGLTAQPVTFCECPFRVCNTCRLPASQILTSPFSPPATSSLPSGPSASPS